jgi:hypothetical protein
MALWRTTGGSDDGLDLFDSWSAKCPRYDASYTAAKWDGYERCPPTDIGAGSIFYMADQASSTWRREYEELVARRRAEQIKINIDIGGGPVGGSSTDHHDSEEMIARLVWMAASAVVTVKPSNQEEGTALLQYAASDIKRRMKQSRSLT